MNMLPVLRESVREERLTEAVCRVYVPGKTLSPDAIQQLGGRYGAMQGYWAYYLRAVP
jgi:hypothetical protein